MDAIGSQNKYVWIRLQTGVEWFLDFTSFYICTYIKQSLSKRINQCVHSRIGGGVGQRDPKSKLIIVYVLEAHTGTLLVRKTCTLELDFKRVLNGCFWPDSKYLKTRKGQICLPLLLEVLKTASAVIKKNLFWGINSVYTAVSSFIDCTSCTCQASTK